MAVSNPLEAFIWGAGGAKKTPEEIAREKEIAAQMLMKAGNTSPVEHWTQGAARVADALSGVIKERRANAAGEENATYNQDLISSLLGGGKSSPSGAVPASGASGEIAATAPSDLRAGIVETANALGIDPVDLGTAISYETAGTFDPTKKGPTTQWGQHQGLIQFGEPQAQKYGVDWANPVGSQLGADGAVAKYLRDTGVQPGMGLMDIYSAINAGGVGRYGASDANNGGAPGTVADKVNQQMAGHRAKALALLGQDPAATPEAAIEAVSPVAGVSLADPTRSAGVQEVAQALPDAGQAQQQDPAINEAIFRAIADPRATPETKAVAQALLQQQMARQQAEQEMRMKQADPAYQIGLEKSRLEVENLRNPRLTPGDQLAREKFDFERGTAGQTNDIKEYEYAKQQGYAGSFADFQQSMKKAGAASTNVTVGEGNKFYEALDKKNAETFSALSEEGMRGRGKLAQIDRLEQLMATAPQGGIGALKLAAGEYGIDTDGLSDIQAAQALINELVPQQRQPGSGPMSDADLALFKQSLPRIINQPGGNQTILQTMRGITQYQIQMGEIADAVANREMSPDEARKAIRSLDNPLDAYTKAVRQMENDEQDSGWRELTPGVRVRKVE
jgi:flagellar protein FlgJ